MLPAVLVEGNRLVFDQRVILPSLSDYYNSDMRDWFVGSLWAIGAGLLVYLASRRNLADSVISFVAGLLAIAVSLFPTNIIGEPVTTISVLHVVCASALFGLLGVICFRFGNRDGRRKDRTETWQRTWRWVHRGCALVVWGAVVTAALATQGAPNTHAVLVGETLAVAFFGLSWFLKGSELFNQLRVEHGQAPILRKPVPGRESETL
jgi:hypothetical protein